MGLFRLLYDNKVTDASMVVTSSVRYGLISSALKQGTGSASMTPAGFYSGQTDKGYLVEIDSVAAGKEIGQATFKWSDGSGAWNATGVVTSAAAITLNNGVTIAFTAGAGDDFELGDNWYFLAYNLFKPGNMLDQDRDSRYRSKELETPNTITIDLGNPQQITALVLYDHNLTATATITLCGNSVNNFAAPAFSEAVSWSDEKILHYLTAAQTYRYWQIQITDPNIAQFYIEIGELFLGPYLELSKNMVLGASTPIDYIAAANVTPYGIKRRRFYNLARKFTISISYLPAADIADILEMLAAMNSRETGIAKSFYYNEDSATPADTWLVMISGISKSRPLNNYQSVEMAMEEVLRTV